MLRISIVVLVALISASAAIRCFFGQQTIGNQIVPTSNQPFQEMNCPTSDFCFQSYVSRNTNGDNSHTITKSCGEPGKCFETGCEGPGHAKRCCCTGDLCNSSNGLNLSILFSL
ncbi:unnamed protein product [Auanema sp. JU1783]|nr:unnamed protein product [Auanema sp. JU1783]